MRSFIPIAAAIAAAGCAAPPEPSGEAFAREIAGMTAGPSKACVSTFGRESLRVIDGSTLAYGSGSMVYINRLPGTCPGLRPLSTLIVDAQSGQYCRGDRVRAVEVAGAIPGPPCNLGDWTLYRRP